MDSSTLKPGLAYEFKFKIPENKTVPYLTQNHLNSRLCQKFLPLGSWLDYSNGLVFKQ
jgi:hypothetical protein